MSSLSERQPVALTRMIFPYMNFHSVARIASVFALARLSGLASLPAVAPAEGHGLFELGIPHGTEQSRAAVQSHAALTKKAATASVEMSYAYLISDDGSVVIGRLDSQLFRWENGTMVKVSTAAFGNAITPDGSVMVGSAETIPNYSHAFRWVGSVGMDLGTLGGVESYAEAVSADGTVVVGASEFSMHHDRPHAFRWENGVMTDIGAMGGLESNATGVSADGAVVVGDVQRRTNDYRAFRWEGGVMTDLGTLGGRYANVISVSADGRVIAGNSSLDRRNENFRAYRWVDGVMSNLGTLGGGTSFVIDMSPSGEVIVGNSTMANDQWRAFRWADGSMVNLGTLSEGSFSHATAVSASGAVVVGYASLGIDHGNIRAFRWTEKSGMLSVEDWLLSTGVPVAESLATAQALDVSADGMIVVGILSNGHAFIARSAEGLVTIADMQESLAGGATALNMGRSAGELVMNGAHGHPLDRRTAVGRFTAWVGGDIGADNHGERDGSLGVGEMGGGYNFGPAQFNLAVGLTKGNQETFLGGRTDFDGTYYITDVIAPVAETPLVATFTAFHQNGELRTNRGYINAGLVNYASGKTDVVTYGGAARVDWENALITRSFNFTPYVKLSLTHTRVDGYAESGGFFPATYDAREDTITELTAGVNMSRVLTSRLTLKTTLEGVHRFQDRSSSIGGEIVSVSVFSLPGEEYRQDWLHGSVGVEYGVSNGIFSISLNATTRGEASNMWLAASHQIHF